ncbi:MAG: hypothetical protein QM820_65500, partial [Minicystis sp.]
MLSYLVPVRAAHHHHVVAFTLDREEGFIPARQGRSLPPQPQRIPHQRERLSIPRRRIPRHRPSIRPRIIEVAPRLAGAHDADLVPVIQRRHRRPEQRQQMSEPRPPRVARL